MSSQEKDMPANFSLQSLDGCLVPDWVCVIVLALDWLDCSGWDYRPAARTRSLGQYWLEAVLSSLGPRRPGERSLLSFFVCPLPDPGAGVFLASYLTTRHFFVQSYTGCSSLQRSDFPCLCPIYHYQVSSRRQSFRLPDERLQ